MFLAHVLSVITDKLMSNFFAESRAFPCSIGVHNENHYLMHLIF